MARRKKTKMNDVQLLHNVFNYENENAEKEIFDFFNNENPITLEIGCGRGDYSVNLAKKYPDRNFIGLDIKGERIWNGSKKADELGLKNVAFLITDASRLPEIFNETKIGEIWIPFPDPHPKSRSEKKRLVSPDYLERYRKILSAEGTVNFKTDDDGLFEYAVEILKQENISPEICTANLYNSEFVNDELEIKTKYEEQHLKEGKIIKFIKFRLK